jgi:hypothetical protein
MKFEKTRVSVREIENANSLRRKLFLIMCNNVYLAQREREFSRAVKCPGEQDSELIKPL